MGHSDEWTFADYFKYEQEIYRAIISAAVLCQWIAEHDTPPTDGEAEELAREIDRRLCEAWGEIFSLAVLKWRDGQLTSGVFKQSINAHKANKLEYLIVFVL